MILTLIKMLLGVVSLLMRRASDAEQREIGRDAYIKDRLAELVERTEVARDIERRVRDASDDDIDRILHDHTRTGPADRQ